MVGREKSVCCVGNSLITYNSVKVKKTVITVKLVNPDP